jgi:UDP-N-acetylmuramoyl-tripeptide--D-alanyl-D-alanine ligase
VQILDIIAYLLFLAAIGYYTITTLQWYSYKLDRMVFHHTKPWWNLAYFLIPFALYAFVSSVSSYSWVVALLYIAILFFWYRGLDKPLVWTQRVKLFFGVLMLFGLLFAFVSPYKAVLIPILIAHGVTVYIEKIRMAGFTRQAKAKLSDMDNLTVIGVTASYGKTSIKNIIAHILSSKYKTYATPRSVNTLGGVIKDINVDLPLDTEVYVVEMGARGEGDIAEIAHLVNEHYAVVGKIGPAHIEYFKTMENIRNTKMEILESNRLREAWVHTSAQVQPTEQAHIYGDNIEDIEATLEGTSFTLDGVRYTASLLGAFNAENIAAAILIAQAMGIDEETIKQQLSSLKPVDHRLQRIDAGGKVILDDSFNGNIDGTMASFDLASTYEGRKVVITPGLIEVDDELNEQVARRANEVFDLVVVTGELNYPIFKKLVDSDKLLKLDSKAQMEQMLVEQTKAGDLILFANDAPSFV